MQIACAIQSCVGVPGNYILNDNAQDNHCTKIQRYFKPKAGIFHSTFLSRQCLRLGKCYRHTDFLRLVSGARMVKGTRKVP